MVWVVSSLLLNFENFECSESNLLGDYELSGDISSFWDLPNELSLRLSLRFAYGN